MNRQHLRLLPFCASTSERHGQHSSSASVVPCAASKSNVEVE
uniref:Uncharacterized protein n=1 Tax=Romanomermis culicivorax TaxID=13658 RepID=A0A915JQE5_ROMCU